VRSRRGRLLAACGGSLDGGRDEVRESCCSCSRNCSTIASNAATLASRARMWVCASAGVCSHISGDKRGSLFMSRHGMRPRYCLARRSSRSDHVNVYEAGSHSLIIQQREDGWTAPQLIEQCGHGRAPETCSLEWHASPAPGYSGGQSPFSTDTRNSSASTALFPHVTGDP
jgi:hypothetical protein